MNPYRDTFEDTTIGEITQGSVFVGGISKSYKDNETYGVIITPRCDIAQKKVLIYYYLPMVSFESWLAVDFPLLFINYLKKDTYGGLRSTLKQLNMSDSIVGKYKSNQIKEVADKFLDGNINNALKKFLDKLSDVEKYQEHKITDEEIISKYHKFKEPILNDLISNKNPDFYLIENRKFIYVIRVKELNRLTRDFLFKLAGGIDHSLSGEELRDNDIRQLNQDELFMPIFKIKSPYIEHIMQHFMQQFNRIGVEDLCDVTIRKIKGI